jgi:surface protein
LSFNQVKAQDFITKWNLDPFQTSISFGVVTSGNVNYTWQTIPTGTSGSGSFSGITATISGLPLGAAIRLNINPTNFKQIIINNGVDRQKLVNVEQWGAVAWTGMQSAFNGCSFLNITASDIPDLSLVTNMSEMFLHCYSLNNPTNINNWNTSNVTNMNSTFQGASAFNQAIGNWNTANFYKSIRQPP